MNTKEIALATYIIEVAIMEIPLIKILTAINYINGGEIEENITLGNALLYYINSIPNRKELSEDGSQEAFEKAYAQFKEILEKDVNPILEERKKSQG